ncbi:MAG: phosphotransferase family protein [Anaerolineales bacterium]
MSETIPVRPDERFDEARLADYLRDKLPGADAPLTVEQFPGGAANLTYLLRFGAHEYVLRRPPLGQLAQGAHDMSREYRVLSVLYQQFPYAPRAYHLCEDVGVIGAPFIIMARQRGVVVRRNMPPTYETIPDAPRQLAVALVDRLADFHAVDYKALRLADLGRPAGFVARQIDGWYKRWQKAKVDDVPAMERLHTWLNAHQPPENPPTLLHNDYKLDNTMFSPDHPSKMVAIFDWYMCTLGDPLVDVGTLLAYWSEPGDPDCFRGLLGMPGAAFPVREELVARYAAQSGRDVTAISFYHVLALYRLVVIVAQIYVRYHRGQTQDQRFASFGGMIPIIADHALRLAKTSG